MAEEAGEDYHAHGGYFGHVLPGTLFLIWSVWWSMNLFARWLHCTKTKRAFVSRSWFLWRGRGLIEPILKIVLPSFGILVELRLGHKAWRHLTDDTGHLIGRTLNNWQHAVMYSAVVLSGCVDLLAHYAGAGQLPAGTEQGFLALGFLVNFLLFAFHLKGPPIEVHVHLLLVFIIFACFVLAALEIPYPESALLAITRAACVFFQGTWFIQVGHILYSGDPAWDVHDHAAVMFLPVVFVLHMMLIAAGYLLVFIGLYWCFLKYGSLGLDEGEHSSEGEQGQHQELAVLIAKDHV